MFLIQKHVHKHIFNINIDLYSKKPNHSLPIQKLYSSRAAVYSIFVILVYFCLETFETELKFAMNEIFYLPCTKFLGIICITLLSTVNN